MIARPNGKRRRPRYELPTSSIRALRSYPQGKEQNTPAGDEMVQRMGGFEANPHENISASFAKACVMLGKEFSAEKGGRREKDVFAPG